MSRAIQGLLVVVSYILLIPLLPFAVRIVQEYERGVIFRLGRLQGARGPGLFVVLPIVERMVRVDLRTVTMDVPSQEAITKDNVTVRVNAVVYFHVLDPEASVVKVIDHFRATSQISQTTLRSVLGQSLLDELLSEREEINQRLQKIIDEQTEPWGVKVTVVEIKDVELPQGMQRAMARQAEAERERRAKIINAEGEHQAAQRLSEAGRVMTSQPGTLQLRVLQTLSEIATERNSTIIFPVPVDLIAQFLPGVQAQAAAQIAATGGAFAGSTSEREQEAASEAASLAESEPSAEPPATPEPPAEPEPPASPPA